MMNEAAYAEANRTYWTHRAPSYGDVNRKELATAQRRIWTQTLDVRIQARFPDRAAAASVCSMSALGRDSLRSFSMRWGMR